MRHWKVALVAVSYLLGVAARLPSREREEETRGPVSGYFTAEEAPRVQTNVPEEFVPDERLLWQWFTHDGEGRIEADAPEADLRSQPHGQEGDNVISTKDYLNGLVAASVANSQQQTTNIAFMKTHKTASTTMAFILYRYARRHYSKLAHFDGHGSAVPLFEAVRESNRPGGKGRCDIMHYHISVFGQLGCTWKDAEKAYRQILRDPNHVNSITVMRDPRTHFLSYYYYFMQPDTQKSVADFLTHTRPSNPERHRLYNPLAAEFGVRNGQDLKYMVEHGLPNMMLVILTEDFDEGLMVLRRLLGWDMVDMTYRTVYKTTTGSTRYDGKELVTTPHFDSLPKHVQNIIDNNTQMDRILYKASKAAYEKQRQKFAKFLEADLVEFRRLQNVVKLYLDENSASGANIMYKEADIYSTEKHSPLYEF